MTLPHTAATSFSKIVRNAGWNVAGTALPLLAAVLAIPYLVDRLGLERFGMLSLIWILIGYFTFFDLGLGRAITKVAAELLGQSRRAELAAACSTAVAFAALLGVTGGLLVMFASGLARAFSSNYSDVIQAEVAWSALLVALAVPLVVMTSALRGVLEGFQQFRLLNLIRIPAGILLFAAPCVAASQTQSLAWAAGALVIARLFVFVAHLVPVRSCVMLGTRHIDSTWAKYMLRFGGWMTVSNGLGPLIVYADRIFIVSMVSASALAFYSAPFEVVSRLLLLPTALTSALFPALANAIAVSAAEAKKLRWKATSLILVSVMPIVISGALLADFLLRFWLGPAFAENATTVMQILLLGFFFNSLAQVPFSTLHSQGVAKQPALLHLAELPAYLIALYVFVHNWGLVGAAWAWTLRALVDLVLLYLLLHFHEARREAGARIESTT